MLSCPALVCTLAFPCIFSTANAVFFLQCNCTNLAENGDKEKARRVWVLLCLDCWVPVSCWSKACHWWVECVRGTSEEGNSIFQVCVMWWAAELENKNGSRQGKPLDGSWGRALVGQEASRYRSGYRSILAPSADTSLCVRLGGEHA